MLSPWLRLSIAKLTERPCSRTSSWPCFCSFSSRSLGKTNEGPMLSLYCRSLLSWLLTDSSAARFQVVRATWLLNVDRSKFFDPCHKPRLVWTCLERHLIPQAGIVIHPNSAPPACQRLVKGQQELRNKKWIPNPATWTKNPSTCSGLSRRTPPWP